jgi:hypothetical protein
VIVAAASPAAGLIADCDAARAAIAAYNAEAGRDRPGELVALFEGERLAFECVASSRARTPRGIAEKAKLLAD